MKCSCSNILLKVSIIKIHTERDSSSANGTYGKPNHMSFYFSLRKIWPKEDCEIICFPSSNVRIFSVWMVAFSAVWRSLSYNNMADIFFLLLNLSTLKKKKKKGWSWQSLRIIIYLYLRCYTKIFYSRRRHKENKKFQCYTC